MDCTSPDCTHRCRGCCIPEIDRINLPVGWQDGDPLPGGLTKHYEPGQAYFAFRGSSYNQDRVPLEPSSPVIVAAKEKQSWLSRVMHKLHLD